VCGGAARPGYLGNTLHEARGSAQPRLQGMLWRLGAASAPEGAAGARRCQGCVERSGEAGWCRCWADRSFGACEAGQVQAKHWSAR
jgi:hypothetical protein